MWSSFIYFSVAGSIPFIFLSFLPIITNIGFTGHYNELDEAIKTSPHVNTSFGFMFGLSVALFFDLLSDLFKARHSAQLSFSKLLVRIFLLAALVVPAIGYCSLKAWSVDSITRPVFCLLILRRVMLTVPLLLHLLNSPSKVFTPMRIVTPLFCSMMYPILIPYWPKHSSIEGAYFIMVLTYLLLSTMVVSILVLSIVYFYYLWQQEKIPQQEYSTIFFLLSIFGCTFFFLYVMVGVQHNYAAEGTVTLNIAVTMFATIAPMQTAKQEKIQELDDTVNLLAMKKSFVRYVSHEIRTPLNVANVGLTMLGDVFKQPLGGELGDSKQIFEQVQEAIDIAIDILNDLLTYDKITSNLMTLETKFVEPFEFVRGNLSLFALQAQQKNVQFILPGANNTAAKGLKLNIDPHKMQQVLRNFVSNAIKFTPSGGTITVKASVFDYIPSQVSQISRSSPASRSQASRSYSQTSLSQVAYIPTNTNGPTSPGGDKCTPLKESWFRVEVIDTGAGIALENIPRLFNEIVQFDANKLQDGKGTGLGLYISKGIVELHGGSVSVHSDGLNRGCTFALELPLELESNVSKSTISSKRRSPSQLFPNTDPWAGLVANNELKGSPRKSSSSEIPSRSRGSSHSIVSPRLADQETASFRIWGKPVIHPQISTALDISSMQAASTSSHGINSQTTRLLDVEKNDISPLIGKRVLIVDDSVASSKMIAKLLNRFSVQTETAENGSIAVNLVAESMRSRCSFDCVLLDNHMPVMNGLTACQEMRNMGYHGPIYGLTGDDTDGEDESSPFMRAGATAVFTKPLNVTAFQEALKRDLTNADEIV